MVRTVLHRLETAVIAIPAVVAIALVGAQAMARHFYHPALVDWSDEVVVYLLMWSVFVSLGRVTVEGTHIRTELLADRLPPETGRKLEIAISLLGIAFLAFLGWQAFHVAQEAFAYDDRTASSLRFPIWIYYAILPVACVGMIAGYLIRLTRLWTERGP
ncbi:MAG: TRAP transporter small permease [Tropicimonas sp.]|uniref:TRAP transporter small permease n=1 Tax=Tropicimonas sp. TaxID=2067044 RepID=UPI003A888E50